ncbi:hypothetical protein CR157_03995 [Halomonas sp. LBP4]|nr:hypothetical protein CR157_03995 [Halomonas sp. LBP4]
MLECIAHPPLDAGPGDAASPRTPSSFVEAIVPIVGNIALDGVYRLIQRLLHVTTVAAATDNPTDNVVIGVPASQTGAGFFMRFTFVIQRRWLS